MIYLCRNKRNGLVKIGFSHTPSHREKTLQSEEPELFFEHVFRGDISAEARLHKRYASRRIRGEWFELTPEDVAEIVSELRADRVCPIEERRAEMIINFKRRLAAMDEEEMERWEKVFALQPSEPFYALTQDDLYEMIATSNYP